MAGEENESADSLERLDGPKFFTGIKPRDFDKSWPSGRIRAPRR